MPQICRRSSVLFPLAQQPPHDVGVPQTACRMQRRTLGGHCAKKGALEGAHDSKIKLTVECGPKCSLGKATLNLMSAVH